MKILRLYGKNTIKENANNSCGNSLYDNYMYLDGGENKIHFESMSSEDTDIIISDDDAEYILDSDGDINVYYLKDIDINYDINIGEISDLYYKDILNYSTDYIRPALFEIVDYTEPKKKSKLPYIIFGSLVVTAISYKIFGE